MQPNNSKTLQERLDSLINTYLFDVEYYSSREGEEESPLWQKEREIQNFASRLPKQDLQEVYQKYQKQNQELLSEIEWRRNNQKSPNPVREQVQKALYDLLLSFENISQGIKINQARERQKEKIHLEQTISRPSVEKKSLVDVAIESGTKIFPSPPKETAVQENTISIEESQKQPKSPNPESPKEEPKKQTKALPSVQPKERKPKVVEEIVFEEALSSDDVNLQDEQEELDSEAPATPEARIEKMIHKYLRQRPTVDWKERDRQEELSRKKLYQKEWEKKEERKKDEQKKTKITTLKLWGKEDTKKKKRWWPF